MSLQSTGPLPYLRRELPLEGVTCAMCGSGEYRRVAVSPPFTVARCSSCEFVYVTPRVPESHLHLVYEWEYYDSSCADQYGYEGYLDEPDVQARTFARKAEHVRRFRESGRLLEVGCAGGFFLKEMRDRGFDVVGIDISPRATEFARDSLGIRELHCGRLEDVDLPERSFDVIAMWDVIEHVSDPMKVLKMSHRLLREGGILVMQTQNIDSSAARLLGKRWHHFKHLEHIYHFSPHTISKALAESGFEPLELTTRDAGKYISGRFFIDRMKRYSRILHTTLRGFSFLGKLSFYVNPLDEFIVTARRIGNDESSEVCS